MQYLLRRAWHILVLRVLPISANHRQNLLYLFRDPWALDNAKEHHRIRETSLIIRNQIGPCGELLEVGCAEGLQSATLRNNCEHLTGVDISPRAVARAGLLVRDATFMAVDVFSGGPVPVPTADLVVACEMIYLLADVGAAISRLESLGKACLITFMDQATAKVEPFLAERAILGRESISHGDLTWHVVWWNSPRFPFT
ncbi:MAG: SAM-dependent methyltransferase [Beijerinckiaceae bacterium]|jgi:hypothetical protein|nr:SAM-dependent methyltransferase [Beijerinckiaceae bacterium]